MVPIFMHVSRLNWFPFSCALPIGSLIGAISLLANLADPSQIGKGLAVAMICPLYAMALGILGFDGLKARLVAGGAETKTVIGQHS